MRRSLLVDFCVIDHRITGKWYDAHHSDKAPGLASVCESADHEYWTNPTRLAWKSAERACTEKKPGVWHLVTISDAAENAEVGMLGASGAHACHAHRPAYF